MTERTDTGIDDFQLQLRQGIERSGLILMVLVAVSALAIAAKSALDGHATGAGRLAITGNAVAVAAAIGACLLIGRRWGARAAALVLAAILMVSCTTAAVSYGTGIAASGVVMLYVSVVIVALFVGARATIIYGVIGAGLMIGMWALERIGVIPGLSALHAQPPGGHLTVKLASLVAITTLMARYAMIQARILEVVRLKQEALGASLRTEAETAAALRSREAQLGVLLDRSPTCTLVFEAATGRMAMANEQALLAHGVATPRALDEHCFFAHPEFTRQRALAALAATAQHGAQRLTWCSKTGGGVELWWDVTLDTLEFNGKPSIVCFALDITDRRRAEQAMREHQVRLEEAVQQRTAQLQVATDEAVRLARVKSEFLANMSHEIRTPLNAVLGLAQLGTRRTHDAVASRSCFDRILTSGRFLVALINDVLDFSKLDSGKVEISPSPSPLAAMVSEAMDLVRERAREKGLVLGCAIDERLPPWVNLDGLRLRQVLANLLSNAVKFTAEGSVFVELVPRMSAGGAHLVVTVRDTGIGMSEEACSRIFEAFEQADTSITRRFGGTGLGLSISQQLARLMGGDLTVSSVPGRGSAFELVLPLEAAQAPATIQAVPQEAGSDRASLAGVRVLVTDDVDINREILTEMLQHAGAKVQCACDGPDAIVLALNDRGEAAFDVVLMDVQMPGMDGCEATRRIHERAPELPVVALTAHALPEERERCLAAGMCAHITKPVDMAELLRVVALHVPARERAEPDIDLSTALSRCAGNEALLRRLLGKFHAQYCGFDADVDASVREGDASFKACIHRVKGTAASLGLKALHAAAQAVEAAGPEARSAQLARLKAVMSQTLGSLEGSLSQGALAQAAA